MLKEAMQRVGATDMEYAQEVADLLDAAYLDLTTAGVEIEGVVDITITESEDQQTGETTWTVDDESTIEDKLVLLAMMTFVRMNFRSPADYDRLANSYRLLRDKLANTDGYTEFDEPAEG